MRWQLSLPWHARRQPAVKRAASVSTIHATIDGENLYQPRVGFNYKLDSARPTQFRGGFGLFRAQRPVSGWAIHTRTPVWSQNITCTSAAGTQRQVVSSNPDQPKRPANCAVVQPRSLTPVCFAVDEGNLAFEHELPWMGLIGAGRAYAYKPNDLLRAEHGRLPPPVAMAVHCALARTPTRPGVLECNRWRVDRCANCSALTKAGSNAAFGQVLMAKNTDEAIERADPVGARPAT